MRFSKAYKGPFSKEEADKLSKGFGGYPGTVKKGSGGYDVYMGEEKDPSLRSIEKHHKKSAKRKAIENKKMDRYFEKAHSLAVKAMRNHEGNSK